MTGSGVRLTCILSVLALLISLLALVQIGTRWHATLLRERLRPALFLPEGVRLALPGDWATAPRRVLIAGDSRVAQWAPLPALPGAAVGISAKGGETAAELGARLDRDVLTLAPPPDHVVLAVGINDLSAAAASGLPVAPVADQLSARILGLADRLRAAGIGVSLMSILQPAEPDALRRRLYWDPSLREMVVQTNARLAEAAAVHGAGWIDVNATLSPGQTPLAPVHAVDTLHLTSAAYEELNALLMSRLPD